MTLSGAFNDNIVLFLSDFSLFIFSVVYIKKWNEVLLILPILAYAELTMDLLFSREYHVATVSSQCSSKASERQEILETRMGLTICCLIIPI